MPCQAAILRHSAKPPALAQNEKIVHKLHVYTVYTVAN